MKYIRNTEIEKVNCKHDGRVAYCNALSCKGECICRDTLCQNCKNILLKNGTTIEDLNNIMILFS